MKEDRKIGPEIHCTDLKLSRNLSAHVRKSGVDEVTMMHGWIIRYLYENREQDIFQKDIEQRFAVGRSTVTNLIQLMEKKGIVKRDVIRVVTPGTNVMTQSLDESKNNFIMSVFCEDDLFGIGVCDLST